MPNHGFKFKVQHLIMLWSFLANERERVLKNPLKLAIGYVTMGFHKVAPSYAHQADQHAAGSIDCQDIGKLPDPSAIWGQRGFAQIRQAEIRKKLIKRFITVLSDPVRNIQRYCNAAGNQSLHSEHHYQLNLSLLLLNWEQRTRDCEVINLAYSSFFLNKFVSQCLNWCVR